jgi:hypothetical protein
VCRIVTALSAIFGLYGAVKGGSLADLRGYVAAAIVRRLASHWVPAPRVVIALSEETSEEPKFRASLDQ